jgi:hypothetical protein
MVTRIAHLFCSFFLANNFPKQQLQNIIFAHQIFKLYLIYWYHNMIVVLHMMKHTLVSVDHRVDQFPIRHSGDRRGGQPATVFRVYGDAGGFTINLLLLPPLSSWEACCLLGFVAPCESIHCLVTFA